MSFIDAQDVISGREGSIYAKIDKKVAELAEVRSLNAKVELQKQEIKALGYRGTQYKVTGFSGKGSCSYYYATSRWARMIADYIKTGKVTYFSIIVTNEDPDSNIGSQKVRLGKCCIDGADVAKIDIESQALDGSFDFTFSELEFLEEFEPIFE